MSAPPALPTTPTPGTVIITMAGGGRRFREAGYDCPKFQVMARGRRLFDWSMSSLALYAAAGWRFIFIAQAADAVGPFLDEACPGLGITDRALVTVDGLTDGQATTVLAAAPLMDGVPGPVVIYNIDTYVEPDGIPPAAIRGDGWIPCFTGKGDGWSFARTADGDDRGDGLRVLELREKQRISPHCTIGLYHFSRFALYQAAYRRYYDGGGNLEKGERYIAPLYNQLIADGHPVYIHPVPADTVHPLGTPAEVAAFVQEGARP